MLKSITAVLAAGVVAIVFAATAQAATPVPKNLKAQILGLANQCKKDSPPTMILGSKSTSCGLYGPKKVLDYLRKHETKKQWALDVADDRKVVALCSRLKPVANDGPMNKHEISWDSELGFKLECYWGATFNKSTVSIAVSLPNPGKLFESDVCQETILAGPKQYCSVINGTVNLYDPFGDEGPWSLRAAISTKGSIMFKRWRNINAATQKEDYNVFTFSAIALGLFPPPHTDG